MSKYPPKVHLENNFQNIVRIIDQFPLATIVSSGEGDILITHLPLVYKSIPGSFGKLIGHLDRCNPHSRYLEGNSVKVVFNGPDTYISPSTYMTDQLPTWNYIKVHLEGNCSIINSNEEVKKSMVEMIGQMENNLSGYHIEMDDPKMEKLINYVIGFEIDIKKWEGRFKLSQNRNTRDMLNAKEKLKSNAHKQLDEFIETIYSNHQNNIGI